MNERISKAGSYRVGKANIVKETPTREKDSALFFYLVENFVEIFYILLGMDKFYFSLRFPVLTFEKNLLSYQLINTLQDNVSNKSNLFYSIYFLSC